jgi:hypothetical protein
MKLGTVKFEVSYVVDLDNEEMVDHAKMAIDTDVRDVVKMNEQFDCITLVEDETLKESDIPVWLLTEDTEC